MSRPYTPGYMHKHDVYEKPIEEEPYVPDWTPPAPPNFGEREWFVMIYERFGFLIASAITVLILGILFLNTDILLREPDTPVESSAEVTETQVDEQTPPPIIDPPGDDFSASMGPGATGAGSSILPDSLLVAVPFSVTTNPAQASVFANGTMLGTSPVTQASLPQGRYLISVQREDFAQVDTFITLTGDSLSLQLFLTEALDLVAMEEEIVSEDTVLARDEEEGPSMVTPDSTLLTAVEEEATEPPTFPEDQALTPEEGTDEGPVEAETTPATNPPVTPEETIEETEPPAQAEVVEPPPPPVGSLQINSEPSGAAVSLDGQAIGVTPVTLTDVAVGTQAVTLSLEGYADYTTTVTVAAQNRTSVNGVLEPLQGTLKVLARPWGTIYIDGTLHKREADIWYSTKLAPGTYTVEIEHATLGRWKQQVVIVAGEERSLEVDFN